MAEQIPNIDEPLVRASDPLKITQRWWNALNSLLVAKANNVVSGALVLGVAQAAPTRVVQPGDFAIYINTFLSVGGVTLPSATGSGRILVIKSIGSNLTHTIQPQPADSIEGGTAGATFTMPAGKVSYMIQDAFPNQWWILMSYLTMTGL
jgi:hypothetical protein